MTNPRDRLPFFLEADRLKVETRANWTWSEPRVESVAEHVWHATLLAMLFQDAAPGDVDVNHVRDLLVVHDLVEVYAGDTVLWDNVPDADVSLSEKEAGERLVALLPEADREPIDSLWREFQAQQTPASRWARAIDAFHPMVMSWTPPAQGHANKTLTPTKILKRKRPFLAAYPALWDLARWLVRQAVDQGLIPDDQSPLIAYLPDDCPLADRLPFFVATDALKHIRRANMLFTEPRNETVAEHCWHVTLLAMLLRDLQPQGVDADHVRDLLTVHDLVEVYAGDTPIADVAAQVGVAEREADSAARLLTLLPDDQRVRFANLIDEFQAQETDAAKFARAVDALHPVILTWLPGGCRIPTSARTVTELLDRKKSSVGRVPALWDMLQEIAAGAVARGELSPE